MSAEHSNDDLLLERLTDSLGVQALEAIDDGLWIFEEDGAPVYRNASAASMESKLWSQGRVLGSIDDFLFSEENIQKLRSQGRCSAEYHLASIDSEPSGTPTVVSLEMRSLQGDDAFAGAFIVHARDVSREWQREQTLHDRNVELAEAYSRLTQAQNQLLQSEKMASIGQLAAGVAHEINNPIGYVHSNLGTLESYVRGIFSIIETYDRIWRSLPAELQHLAEPIDAIKGRIDYDFLLQDLPQLLSESRDGINRVKKIVLDLRDFSRDSRDESDDWSVADVRVGIESTLNIVRSELKYKAEIVCELDDVPPIECIPSQINQVILNLLINAGHAIEEHGHIEIRTGGTPTEVCISVADDGVGIPKEMQARIFDPFFTTKPVGSGTGLGLSLSYGIVSKHHGRIELASEPGAGTTFKVFLPIRQPSAKAASVAMYQG